MDINQEKKGGSLLEFVGYPTQPDSIQVSKFQALLSCDLAFIVKHVRTRHEAAVFIGLEDAAHRFDFALQEFSGAMLRRKATEDHWNEIMKITDGKLNVHYHALLPLIKQAGIFEDENSVFLLGQITECRAQFLRCRDALEHFIEQNTSIAIEFSAAGCEANARTKTILADVERILVRRLTFLISFGSNGTPCDRELNTVGDPRSWETMVNVCNRLVANNTSDHPRIS